jgi:hypothetical protein
VAVRPGSAAGGTGAACATLRSLCGRDAQLTASDRICEGAGTRYRGDPQGSRAIGSAGERLVHTEEVTGSIPVSPTTERRSGRVSRPGDHVPGVLAARREAVCLTSAITGPPATLNAREASDVRSSEGSEQAYPAAGVDGATAR